MNSGQQSSQKIHENNESSLLLEPQVMKVMLALLLIALWYRFIPLIVVSAFLELLFAVITIWKKKSLVSVEPGLKLSKSRLFTDEEFQIHASLYNNKWLPLIWIEWSFPKAKGISLGDSEGDVHCMRFLWLLWFQRINWTLNGKALKRGVYDIGQVTLRSGDGFRFTETEKPYALDNKIYVYPRIVSVDVPAFRPSMQWGLKGKQGGFLEDPLLVVGIREYQDGDELRRFNWRASARTGKLHTNVYQPVITEQLIIYADVGGYVINAEAYEDLAELKEYLHEKSEAFEEFLSVIASVALKYRNQGISVGFAGNGLAYNGKMLPGLMPAMNLAPLLDQLAQITQRVRDKKMTALDEMLHKGKLYTPLLVFCCRVDEDHYAWYQQNRNKLSAICFYYKDESEYSKKLASAAKPIDTLLSSGRRA